MAIHTRHVTFGFALPFLIAITAVLSQQATPDENAHAQAMSATIGGIITTLVVGVFDLYKGYKLDFANLANGVTSLPASDQPPTTTPGGTSVTITAKPSAPTLDVKSN